MGRVRKVPEHPLKLHQRRVKKTSSYPRPAHRVDGAGLVNRPKRR